MGSDPSMPRSTARSRAMKPRTRRAFNVSCGFLASATEPARDEVVARLLEAERARKRLVPRDHVALEVVAARVVEVARERLGRAVVVDPQIPRLFARAVAEAVR